MSSFIQSKIPQNWRPASPTPGWARDPSLRVAFKHCRRITREHAKSFYFSSVLLPSAKRKAAYAIYAFCRHIDDVIDDSEDYGTGALMISAPTRERLQADLQAIENGTSNLPFAPAFHQTAVQFDIPRQFFLDLIEGCCRDREPVEMTTFAELEEYCYYVAGVVGLMMTTIFGLRDPSALPRAIEMGIAMQLTNILRDIREDLSMGRIYLPSAEWSDWGITREHLTTQRNDDHWRRYLQFQIARARRYYQRGEQGLAMLEEDGSRQTATLMGRIYQGILDEIESADYDVFKKRHFVPLWRKLTILGATLYRS